VVQAEPEDSLADRLAGLAREHEAERIVVGLPRNMDGTRGPAAASAERLAASLRAATGLPVETFDERLTSVAAERSLLETGMKRDRRRKTVDQVAAALLLQAYLSRMRSKQRAG
jgi:putative Holliday junction resolvase